MPTEKTEKYYSKQKIIFLSIMPETSKEYWKIFSNPLLIYPMDI